MDNSLFGVLVFCSGSQVVIVGDAGQRQYCDCTYTGVNVLGTTQC